MKQTLSCLFLLAWMTGLAQGAVGVRLTGPDNRFIHETTGSYTFKVTLFSEAPLGELRLDGIVRSYVGKRQETKSRTLQTQERTASWEVPFDFSTYGMYEFAVRVYAADGRELTAKTTTFAIVRPVPESPAEMGVCTHYGQTKWQEPERAFRLAAKAGFTRIRDELYWSVVEREKGTFVFPERYDAYLKLARRQGLDPLIIFSYGNSLYSQKKRGFPLDEPTTEAFLAYVRALMTRYGELVHTWELWNEPNDIRPAEEYLPLLKRVHETVKAINPDATLISCGGAGAGGGPGGDYIAAIVGAGGADFQDGFSVHPYMSPYEPDRGYPAITSPIREKEVSVPSVWRHLGAFAEKNPRSDGKPLAFWVTEIGWPTGTSQGTSELQQAAYFARVYLQARRWNTAKAVFWYDLICDGPLDSHSEHNFGILNRDFSPKPAYVAAAVLSRFLGNEPFVKAHLDGTGKIYEYGTGERRFLACWSTVRERVDFPVPEGCTVLRTDWDGTESKLTPKDGSLRLGLTPNPFFLQLVPSAE